MYMYLSDVPSDTAWSNSNVYTFNIDNVINYVKHVDNN